MLKVGKRFQYIVCTVQPFVLGICLTLLDPATNEELGTVPEMGLEETKEAIEAASRAFPKWSRTTPKVWLCFIISNICARPCF